jgi:four helix bundle protein
VLPPVESHRDLIVWQKAMDLVVLVYELSAQFPAAEDYRLTSQITRAGVSVPANIAEGYWRSATKDYAHFLAIAKGSLMETETLLMLGVRLKYMTSEAAQPGFELLKEVEKMLTTLRRKLLN